MLFSTYNQPAVFMAAVYAGLVMGFVYDLFRGISHVFHFKAFMTGLMDLLFWILAVAVAFVVLYVGDQREIRFFALLGFGLGGLLYALGISAALRWMGSHWVGFLKRALRKVAHWPFIQRIFR